MSSMVQDAYDMGITTSLGGMPKEGFYENDYEDNYEDEDEEIEYDEDELSIGDSVLLKSGGPIMLIKSLENNAAKCEWFDKNNVLQTNIFNLHALNNVENMATFKSGGPLLTITA
jgi:uncharacterized protein YodC (DUF2158 family)